MLLPTSQWSPRRPYTDRLHKTRVVLCPSHGIVPVGRASMIFGSSLKVGYAGAAGGAPPGRGGQNMPGPATSRHKRMQPCHRSGPHLWLHPLWCPRARRPPCLKSCRRPASARKPTQSMQERRRSEAAHKHSCPGSTRGHQALGSSALAAASRDVAEAAAHSRGQHRLVCPISFTSIAAVPSWCGFANDAPRPFASSPGLLGMSLGVIGVTAHRESCRVPHPREKCATQRDRPSIFGVPTLRSLQESRLSLECPQREHSAESAATEACGEVSVISGLKTAGMASTSGSFRVG